MADTCACSHPWGKLVTVAEDQLQCQVCMDILTKTQVRISHSRETMRLGQAIRDAVYDLSWGNPEYAPHAQAYTDAMTEYREFTAVHSVELPI